jgi:hypothetical protein
MNRCIAVVCLALFGGIGMNEAGAQFAAAPSTVLAIPPSAAVGVSSSPVIGTIPMRRGLFGWRVENVPVFAAAPAVAPGMPVVTSAYQSARPVITTVPTFATTAGPTTAGFVANSSGAFAFPVVPAPVASVPASNAVIQSGYRGFSAPPVFSVPVQSAFAPTTLPVSPWPVAPVNSFFPGSVMTMQ